MPRKESQGFGNIGCHCRFPPSPPHPAGWPRSAELHLGQSLALGMPGASCQRSGFVMERWFRVIKQLLKAALCLERELGSRHSTPGPRSTDRLNLIRNLLRIKLISSCPSCTFRMPLLLFPPLSCAFSQQIQLLQPFPTDHLFSALYYFWFLEILLSTQPFMFLRLP